MRGTENIATFSLNMRTQHPHGHHGKLKLAVFVTDEVDSRQGIVSDSEDSLNDPSQ